jgi:hypothetical protein
MRSMKTNRRASTPCFRSFQEVSGNDKRLFRLSAKSDRWCRSSAIRKRTSLPGAVPYSNLDTTRSSLAFMCWGL